jgi:hypothetical protein
VQADQRATVRGAEIVFERHREQWHHHPRRPCPTAAIALPIADFQSLLQRRETRLDLAAGQLDECLDQPRLEGGELSGSARRRFAVGPQVIERLLGVARIRTDASQEHEVEQAVERPAALRRELKCRGGFVESVGDVAAPPGEPGAKLEVGFDARSFGELAEFNLRFVQPADREQVRDAVPADHRFDRQAVAGGQVESAVDDGQRLVCRAEAHDMVAMGEPPMDAADCTQPRILRQRRDLADDVLVPGVLPGPDEEED